MSDIHLITGGAGFIGSHLAKALVESGKKVRIIDNFTTGDMRNLEGIQRGSIWNEDIRFTSSDAFDGVSHVYHLAALGSVERSILYPRATEDVNVLGTLNMLELARAAKVERFVFASSSSVYGHSTIFPRIESDAVCPASPYALTKLTAEHYCALYHSLHNVPTVSLRYFNVFGPRQRSTGDYCALIPALLNAILRGRHVNIEGGGVQCRDFTYVDTVVRATIRAGEEEEAIGETINVASGIERSVLQVVESIEAILDRKVELYFMPRRKGDVPRSIADISYMRDILDVMPDTFGHGLEETIKFYKGEK